MRSFFCLWASIYLLILASCNNNQTEEIDLSGVVYKDITISRYEKELFALHPDSIGVGLEKLRNDYSFFIGEQIDSFSINSIKNFILDPALIKASEDIKLQYPDLQNIETDLNKALKHLKYYLPEINISNIYTYISGFDFEAPIHFVDSVIVIGLDMYLGSDYYFYPMLGLPKYITYSYTESYITRDCMESISRSLFKENLSDQTFLEKMLYEGKILYFLDKTIPWKDDTIKIVYTKEQLEWCQRNEANMWSFIIDQQFLHNKDRKIINRFMQKGPTTPSFAEESPARTASWIGWQIVRSYMKRHNNLSVKELFEISDAQKFLNDSGYKPKK
ncbi:MAG: hypothetical protein PHT69_01050 [Bacteroidales bacterium]|nr:hypothetical protein [Bacteroidales bacterium]